MVLGPIENLTNLEPDPLVVGVEVGVEQLDVSLDGGAIGSQLPQIGAQGLGGGNGVNCGQGYDFLVE